MGTTPNRGYPYPENTDKVGQGDDAIKALALAVDTTSMEVVPVARGGTGSPIRGVGKSNLGINYGFNQDPPTTGELLEGDIWFKLL